MRKIEFWPGLPFKKYLYNITKERNESLYRNAVFYFFIVVVHAGIFKSIESILWRLFLLLYADIFIALMWFKYIWLFLKSLMCKIKTTVKNSNCSIGPGYSFSLLDVTGNRKMVRQCFLAMTEHFLMKHFVQLNAQICYWEIKLGAVHTQIW